MEVRLALLTNRSPSIGLPCYFAIPVCYVPTAHGLATVSSLSAVCPCFHVMNPGTGFYYMLSSTMTKMSWESLLAPLLDSHRQTSKQLEATLAVL